MNMRLDRPGLILTLALFFLLTAPVAGMALEYSTLDAPLAQIAQGEPSTTPAAQQGSRYSQYISKKQTKTPTPVATPRFVPVVTPAPADTPLPDATPESVDSASVSDVTPEVMASTPISSNVLVDGNRLQQVIGDRLSSTLYAFDDGRDLYRSDDDGVTWALVAASPEITDFVMSPSNSMVLYSGAGLDCGIDDTAEGVVASTPLFRSVDGGASWELLALGDNLVPLLTHPQKEDTLLAADCELPYLSENGGDSWQSKPDRSNAGLWDVYRMVEVAVSSLVGQSSVESANWHYLYASGMDEDGAGIVAYSGDVGETWERITPRISPRPRGISAVAVDPTTAGRLWFTDRNGVWYTDDFGASWQLTILGLGDVLNAGDKLDMSGLTDVLYLSNGDVYVATVEGVYRGKPDSGIWTLVEDGEFGTQSIESLLVTESQPGVLWVNAEDGVYLYPVP